MAATSPFPSSSTSSSSPSPAPRRRRGNPRWANSGATPEIPPQPSAWDRLLYRLALEKDEAAVAALQQGGPVAKQIAQWVRGNRGRFVPESVLEQLDMKEEVEGAHWWGGLDKR